MADMPSDFWSGYIIVVSFVTFVALVWMVVNVYFDPSDDSDVAGHTWDDDLTEGTSRAPFWWFWLILALMVFSVIYLMLYPGLGSFSGALRWSQNAEIDASRLAFAAEFGPERNRVADAELATLLQDAALLESGRRVYRVHCAACHGPEGRGQANLFPDLRDDHWQWGGSADAIEQTLRAGRLAVMPPLGAALGDEGLDEVTDFVVALGEGRGDAPEHDAGRARFAQLCSACHGPDGSGNPLLGAPDLTVPARTYGSGFDAVRTSIAEGRSGQMPAFAGRLDDTQIRLVTAWLLAGRPAAEERVALSRPESTARATFP